MLSTARPRTAPYVWVTWITKLLAGEQSCKFHLWFRSNHLGYSKVPNTFNLSKWCEDHTELIEKRKTELEDQGYEVFLEDQNSFCLEGKSGAKISGKADIVAVRGDDMLVIDCKTGQQRSSDATQVKIYMWALPRANNIHKGRKLRGEIQYRDTAVAIPNTAVNDEFLKRVSDVMRITTLEVEKDQQDIEKLVCASFGECNFCDLTSADCPSRINKNKNEAITDLF